MTYSSCPGVSQMACPATRVAFLQKKLQKCKYLLRNGHPDAAKACPAGTEQISADRNLPSLAGNFFYGTRCSRRLHALS